MSRKYYDIRRDRAIAPQMTNKIDNEIYQLSPSLPCLQPLTFPNLSGLDPSYIYYNILGDIIGSVQNE